MKKKTNIRQVIRKIVREEVQVALKKELTEVFKSLKSKPISETKRVIKKRKPAKLAKDPVLNKILNETRNEQSDGYEEYPTMGGKTFDRNSMASLMGYGNVGSEGNVDRAQMTRGHQGAVVQDEVLAKALNRDYSDVMKAIDKKKNGGVK
tara:strand:+ start:430 stop:879 length:450 start_codon:yes stop_codon:yes gene_type:complete